MRRVVMFLMIFSALMVWAQNPDEPSPETRALLARIDALEKRVAELEAREAPRPSNPEATAADRGRAESTKSAAPAGGGIEEEHNHAEISEEHYPSLSIHGFADVDFSTTNEHRVPSESGFSLGQFVLHLSSPLSKKIGVFGETAFTPKSDGFALSLERAFIRYDYNDFFKISFGRYHTPISYWNTAFHHGAWLQTTIGRPEMIAFHDPLLPVHFVGLQVEGAIPSGGLGLHYAAGIGNGRSFSLFQPGQAGDSDNNRAWVASLFAQPTKLNHFQVGGAFYHDKISFNLNPGSPTPTPPFGEWIASAHAVWTGERPEFLAEFANIHHEELDNHQGFDSQTYYLQLGYRLPGAAHKWKPYYRFEYEQVPLTEPILSYAAHHLRLSTAGLRYDIADFAAFKAEYRNRIHETAQPSIEGLFLQTSFTF